MPDQEDPDLRFPEERRRDNKRKWPNYPPGYIWRLRDEGAMAILFDEFAKNDYVWMLCFFEDHDLIYQRDAAIPIADYLDLVEAMEDVFNQTTGFARWDEAKNEPLPADKNDWHEMQ